MKLRVVRKRTEYNAERLPDGSWLIAEVCDPKDDEPWGVILTDKQYRKRYEEIKVEK